MPSRPRRAIRSQPTRLTATLIVLACCLAIMFGFRGFIFGSGNNREELPVIYRLADIASYPGDPLVAASTSRLNQSTPYVYALSLGPRLFGREAVVAEFVLLYVTVQILLLYAFRSILKSVCSCPEVLVLAGVLGLILLDSISGVVPNARPLFWDKLDPEAVAYSFSFMGLALVVRSRFLGSAVWLLLANLVHPLYALPVLGAIGLLMVVWAVLGRTGWRQAVGWTAVHAAVVLPYALLLWVSGRPSPGAPYDAARVVEIVATPNHFEIPRFASAAFWGSRFVFVAVSLLVGTWVLVRYVRYVRIEFRNARIARDFGRFIGRYPGTAEARSRDLASLATLDRRALFDVTVLAIGLLGFMTAASVAAQFGRISLLVLLTPYRSGVFVFPLLWLGFVAAAAATVRFRSPQFDPGLSIGLLATVSVILSGLACGAVKTYHQNRTSSQAREAIAFVVRHTGEHDMLLDYSDLDVRTACLRPSYFRIKTVPLYADAQVQWYRRLLVYYDVPSAIDSGDYAAVARYLDGPKTINLATVLQRIDADVRYVVVGGDQWEPTDRLAGVTIRPGHAEPVFANRQYTVYRANTDPVPKRIGRRPSSP